MSEFTDLDFFTVTIANGQSLSPAVNLGQKTLVGLQMPATWTAADITFQASGDGGTTFGELETSDGVAANAVAPFTIHTPVALQVIAFDPTRFRGVNCMKVRSGTSSVPVNQGQNSPITLLVRGVL